MAKYECRITGSFDAFLREMESEIIGGSISASREDGSDFSAGDVRCAVRVYERYSYLGNNRVSLSVTLLGCGDQLQLSAITSGGSQAIFFKINTFGEEAFLDKLVEVVRRFTAAR